MLTPDGIRSLRAEVSRYARGLELLSVDHRASSIELAARCLMDASSPMGSGLRKALVASTGLSGPVVEHGLQTTLGLFTRDALLALTKESTIELSRTVPFLQERERAPANALAICVLAGNVFSAAVRPMLLPLLCGHPVLVKAASQDDVLPRALQRALAAVDSVLGQACEVVRFGREDEAHTAALLQGAELVSIYGSDETVSALSTVVNQREPRSRSDDEGSLGRGAGGARAMVVAHGHGLGAAFVTTEALHSGAEAGALASAIARDVAAYDQRGCLSPQAIFVERNSSCDARAFAVLLADALEQLAQRWPRGSMSARAAAEQLQWRGVAAAAYALHVRDSAAVAYEGDGPLRASPGHRNVSVYDCDSSDAMRTRLQPLGPHLKALAVAGANARAALGDLAPYVCKLGAMQEPPLGVRLDGMHPLHGL